MGSKDKCIVDDCGLPAYCRGECRLHYARMNRHGCYEIPQKPSGKYFARYATWMNVKKRHPEGVAWASFKEFQASVGERPGYSHLLVKVREDELIGPDNFQWAVKRTCNGKPAKFKYRTPEGKREYDRSLKEADPHRNKHYNLLKAHGITLDDYKNMVQEQNGVCAICKNPETVAIGGKMLSLSVDHDHETGKVRGLLCTKCNRGLGMFCDDLSNLESATTYLRRHKKADNVVQLKIVEK